MIRFLAGANEFKLHVVPFHLRRAEILEYRQMAPFQFLCNVAGHIYAASHGHEVNIGGWALQHDVAYVAAHNIAFAAKFVGSFANQMEHGPVNGLSQLFGVSYWIK